MRLNLERILRMGELNLPNPKREGLTFHAVLTSARARYLIAVFASLLVHWAAFTLLSSNILIDGVTGRVEGADLVVYLDSSSQPALRTNLSGENKPTNSGFTSSSASSSSHDSGMAIFSSYFPIRELDVAPVIIRDIDVSSEELKKRQSDGGKVILRLWIDETGHPVRVEPVSSELPSIYAETAGNAFMHAEFHPGIKDGKSVRSRINIVLFYPAVPQETSDVPAGLVSP